MIGGMFFGKSKVMTLLCRSAGREDKLFRNTYGCDNIKTTHDDFRIKSPSNAIFSILVISGSSSTDRILFLTS